jgi:DNA-directed RNA polymerase subunit alpha
MEKKTGIIQFSPEWKCVDDQPDHNRRLHYSRFALSPLLLDQAMTIGVAIRRALLSEVEGISITSANIVGALHEYSTLNGVRESVDEILLNLKQIVLKGAEDNSRTLFSQKEYRASIFAQGPGIVTVEHIKFPSSILPVDPDQPIATLLNETQLCIELFIQQGISKQVNRTKKNHQSPPKGALAVPNGTQGFFIDGNFTPVQKANFSIHSVGDPKGLQQLLLLEIWTNKTLTPAEALYQAHASLLNLFHQISPLLLPKELPASKKILNQNSDFDSLGRGSVDKLISLETKRGSIKTNNSSSPKEIQSSVRLKSYTDTNLSSDKQMKETLNKESLSIDELELSTRISNCLKRANIHTIADLVSYTQEDLLKIKNFGRKSVEQVSLVLRKRFNMELLPSK